MNTNSELRAIVENLCRQLATSKIPCKPNQILLTFGAIDDEWQWGLVVAAARTRPRMNGNGETLGAAIDDMMTSPAYLRWRKDLGKA
jgi:hypothetical protein